MDGSGGHIDTRQILPCVKKEISSEVWCKLNFIQFQAIIELKLNWSEIDVNSSIFLTHCNYLLLWHHYNWHQKHPHQHDPKPKNSNFGGNSWSNMHSPKLPNWYSGLPPRVLSYTLSYTWHFVFVLQFFNLCLTLGTLSALQTDSESSLSLISQAKMDGHSLLYSATFPTTPGVATLGLEPPIARGFIEPVS